ncbi:alpha-N-acetylglucosaminidase-like [Strongylocentrotus purpuratus]|uniref:Alpha-N-acetylglucosaminidase n=1 Tax=Strongylocentrotus purpuratus TaxID=7668 RepID=A0A7M7PPL4_STRPU|nr:alpha-N-acetylglucosaminidase-like [Strongylocentrotus purpuratus]
MNRPKMVQNWCIVAFITALTLGHASANGFENELKHLKPQASASTQTSAAQEVIKRLLPTRYQNFKVVVNPAPSGDYLDTFEISADGTTVNVTGTTGVAAVWGVQHYLVHYCNCHISWNGDQLYLPPDGQWPVIHPPIKVTSPNRFRFYQNVCTASYTFAWWDWERWERHIDWMALSGINLPLAFNGQEAIWQKVYLKMGLEQEDLDKHFGGPAFLAWARMGNIDGWGGPLPQSWHTNQLALQHQILKRMRDLGMIPVLPAFAGHVPKSFSKVFPNASISNLGDWGRFGPEYCCTSLLDPQDPMFKQVGKAFVDTMSEEFNGTDHIYSADTFNENKPKSRDSAYLSAASKGVYQGIIEGDPKGVWLMMGWLFQDTGFWGPTQIKALLQGVPIGRMIVLDLYAEARPFYKTTYSFYGQPFIWCMLHNFGGNTGLYGKLDAVNQGPFEARNYANSTMIGMGTTPEGIFQNYVMYNFLTDMTWRSGSTNVSKWIEQYAGRRYSHDPNKSEEATEAWVILKETVYNNTGTLQDHQYAVPVRRPSNIMTLRVWYDYTKVAKAWEFLLQASTKLETSPLFRYDLVDVTRNVLQDLAFDFYQKLMVSFRDRNAGAVGGNGTLLCNLILDMDNITSSHEDWLLGTWLEDAKSLATNDDEESLYEYNAKNQITIWGPKEEILDYANKQWGGLLRTYYHRRWQLYVQYLEECIQSHQPYDQNTFNVRSFVAESEWTHSKEKFPTEPVGDTMAISKALYVKYEPFIKEARTFSRAEKRMENGGKLSATQERLPYSYMYHGGRERQ